MPRCNLSQFPFEVYFSRQRAGRFDSSRLTTDGGGPLLCGVGSKRSRARVVGRLRGTKAAPRSLKEAARGWNSARAFLASYQDGWRAAGEGLPEQYDGAINEW